MQTLQGSSKGFVTHLHHYLHAPLITIDGSGPGQSGTTFQPHHDKGYNYKLWSALFRNI
jgi:hypothetical protein